MSRHFSSLTRNEEYYVDKNHPECEFDNMNALKSVSTKWLPQSLIHCTSLSKELFRISQWVMYLKQMKNPKQISYTSCRTV
jgi:hypothetical protein